MPQDSDNTVTKKQLETAANMISATLEHMGISGQFEVTQTESLTALAHEISSDRGVSQEALTRGAEIISEMQPDSPLLDQQTMRDGIEAAAQYLSLIKGKHTSEVMQNRSGEKSRGRE